MSTPVGLRSPCSRPRIGRLRRALAAVFTVSAGILILTAFVLPTTNASAATVTADQCNNNGPGPMGATTGMTCSVTVVNVISGGHTSSTTTMTRLCTLGPCAPGNGTFVTHSTDLVTQVTQCNGSDNDAAHPITCHVSIENRISSDTPGAAPLSNVTSNQCVGSATGGGGSLVCSPFPATTTGATVTQCNGSGTGGGGTVDCTVGAGSRISSAIPVRVNQCNGTGNPGGSTVTCDVTITTTITAAVSSPSASATSSSGGPTRNGGAGSSAGSSSGSGASGNGTNTSASSAAGTGGQVTRVPTGSVQAGDGSTAGLRHANLIALGAGLLLCAGISAGFSRRHIAAHAARTLR